ncbi:MAG: DUF6391 domain-containing protein [Candidatus Promineifilaceae bacterium]
MLANLISRTRRNHGLEHATIHVLSQKKSGFSAQGNSTPYGFYLNIYGDVSEEDVRKAVNEAHSRMKGGETHLAVHPNCGTVLLTTATMSTLAAQAMFSMEQRRQKSSKMSLPVLLNALPAAVLAVTMMLIVSRPLGMALQEHFTTDGNLGDLEITEVRKIKPSPMTRLFQVLLGQTGAEQVRAYQITTVG